MAAIPVHCAIRVANCVDTIHQPKKGYCNVDGAFMVLKIYVACMYILYITNHLHIYREHYRDGLHVHVFQDNCLFDTCNEHHQLFDSKYTPLNVAQDNGIPACFCVRPIPSKNARLLIRALPPPPLVISL